MKYTIRILTIYIVVFLCVSCCNAKEKYDPKRFDAYKGINISSWFSQSINETNAIEKKFTNNDIHLIKDLGFDHVRIPIDDTYLFDEKLNEREDRWKILLEKVDTCIALGLRVIIDLHKSRVHYPGQSVTVFTDKEAEAYFLNTWSHIQNRFKNYQTSMLAYECLNEPHPWMKSSILWNSLLSKWIKQIRKKEPRRFLFISSAYGNNVDTFDKIELPKKDRYLVLSFHYYRPNEMCFFDGKTENGDIPEFSYSDQVIMSDVSKVMKVAHKYNLQVNCGEFGCRRFIPDSLRYSWFADMIETFKTNDISYTLWGFNGSGYGIKDATKTLDVKMIETLQLNSDK